MGTEKLFSQHSSTPVLQIVATPVLQPLKEVQSNEESRFQISENVGAVSLIILFGTSAGVSADEADAKRLLKAMSDYVGAQKAL